MNKNASEVKAKHAIAKLERKNEKKYNHSPANSLATPPEELLCVPIAAFTKFKTKQLTRNANSDRELEVLPGLAVTADVEDPLAKQWCMYRMKHMLLHA
jgi:hypothetical protein